MYYLQINFKMKNLLLICCLLSMVFIGCQNENKTTSEEQDNQTAELEANIVEKTVTYGVDGKEFNGTMYFDENKADQSPGILVVHEWWGHNDYSKMRAKQLAELGYVGFAIDMYGDGKQASHPEDAMKFSAEVMQNFDTSKSRFTEAMAILQNHEKVDADKIGAIGYCFGGGVVLSMANLNQEQLDGVVSFHGTLELPVMPSEEVNAKVLVLNGADDPFVTQEQIDNFRNAMNEADADYEFINYDDAVHAYTSPMADSLGQKFDLPLAYNQVAADESWDEMKTFFTKLWN